MAILSGYNARIKVSGVPMLAREYSIRLYGDEHDVTCAREDADAGFFRSLVGIIGAEVTFVAYYSEDDNPFNFPIALFIGALPLVQVELDKNLPDSSFLCYLRILSAVSTAQTRGCVTYEVMGRSFGAVTLPTY